MDNELKLYVKAVDQAGHTIDNVGRHVDTLGSKIKTALSFAGIATGIGAVVMGLRKVEGILESGFDAMEDLRMSTASMASLITTFAEDAEEDLVGTYRRAYDYSERLVRKMEDIDARTIATGKDLNIIVQTLIQGGVLLDINNQKQLDGFVALTNAVKILTKGQEGQRQIIQEIRALVNGQVDDSSMLARMLDQQVGGNLKEHLRIWKEEGTVIENIGKLVKGFAEGTKDMENTWTAVRSTLDTISNRILREIMAPTYEDIVRTVKELTDEFTKQKGSLKSISDMSQAILGIWLLAKDTVTVISDLPKMLPKPLDRLGDLQKAFLYALMAFEQALAGHEEKAAEFWDKTVASLKEVIALKKQADEKLYGPGEGFYGPSASLFWENWSEENEKIRLQQKIIAEEARKKTKAAAKLLEAEADVSEAISKRSLINYKSVLEENKIALDQSFKDRLVSISAYYNQQITMAENLTRKEISELEKRKSAVEKIYAKKIEGAEEDKKGALEVEKRAALMKIDVEILEKRAAGEQEIMRLEIERKNRTKQYSEERLDTELSVLSRILNSERATAAQRHAVWDDYKKSQTEKIQAEADEWRKAGVSDVLIAEAVSVRKKEIEADLRLYTYDQLKAMSYDERATADRRVEIHREMRKRILEGEATNWEAFKFGWNEVMEEADDTYRHMVESGRRAAQGIKDAFSDFFFDAMTGEMKSFKDYWQSFWRSMARIRSEELARQAYKGLFGGEGGSPLGSIIKGIGSIFGGGGAAASTAAGLQSREAINSAIASIAGGLPQMQHGGVAEGPVIAGEGRYREGIVPLPDGRHIPAIIKDQAGGQPIIYAPTYISALDPASFDDYCRRNPGPILRTVAEDYDLGGIMRMKVREAF